MQIAVYIFVNLPLTLYYIQTGVSASNAYFLAWILNVGLFGLFYGFSFQAAVKSQAFIQSMNERSFSKTRAGLIFVDRPGVFHLYK